MKIIGLAHWIILILVAIELVACGSSGVPTAKQTPAAITEKTWVSTWGTALYTSYPNGPLTQGGISVGTGTFTGNEAINQSFRMMVQPSLAGTRARIRLSNAYGTQPLVLENASIAVRQGTSSAAINAATLKPLLFNGQKRVTIPVGQEVISDGAEIVWTYGDQLAVNFHAPFATGAMTWHAEAFSTQYASMSNSGDTTTETTGAQFNNIIRGWFFLTGVDVEVPSINAPPSLIFFGDSITDGFGSTPEKNDRYPDVFAQRLQNLDTPAGIVNLGINSNSVTPARDSVTTGEPGIMLFGRDALTRNNVTTLFILEGTNDLSSGILAQTVYDGLVNIAQQAQAQGICVVVSTILPRNDPPVPFGWDAATEEPQRQTLNNLILNSTIFDAVVDLGRTMETPGVANQPFQPYFVEGLHPNTTGYAVMANAIPPEVVLPPPLGRCVH